MRKQVLSKTKNRSIRMYRDISEPYILKPNRVMAVDKERLGGHQHIRSKTRLFQENTKDKTFGYSQTPASFLPKIYENKVGISQNQQRNEMDSLQTYVHRLLLKNLKQYKLHKQVKSVEEQVGKKKLNMMEQQQQTKKQKEKSKLQQLRLKLNQLYGQLEVEQKQLKIEYEVQAKMQSKYNNYYDKIARRFKNTTVDTAQNTQQAAISIPNDNRLKPSSKGRSRFRAVALAVYFSIMFPNYSKLFNLVRKKDHQQRIIKSNGLNNAIQKSYALFEMMKLKVLWIQLEYKNKSLPNEEVVVNLHRKAHQDSFTFKVQNITSLVKFILNSILSTINEGKIDQLIKALSLTVTNRSFLTPKLFLQQQLQYLSANENLTMNVSGQQERRLMVDLVLSKLTGFGFMINHRYTNSQSKYIITPLHNKFQNLSASISQQLLVAGLYLMSVCSKAHEQRCKQEESKEGNKKCDGLVLPMDQLQIKEQIVIKSESAKKRSSIQSYVDHKNIQVRNVTKLQSLIDVFQHNNAQPDILKLINQLQQIIYLKSQLFKKQFYQSYKNKAFDQFRQLKQELMDLAIKDEQKQKMQNNQIMEQIHEQGQIGEEYGQQDAVNEEEGQIEQQQVSQSDDE